MACVTTKAKILIRRDTSTSWTNINPILGDGEMGYEKDTGKLKIGDGIRTWNQLPYFQPQTSTLFDGGLATTVYKDNDPLFDLGGVN